MNVRTDSKRIFVVIAAYNEHKKIAGVIDDLHAHGYDSIVVVDDFSTDNTANVAERKHAIVLRHPINRGQGAALKTGMEYALVHGADVIVTFDADGQHHASDIASLLEPVLSGTVDVALGSRFLLDSTQKNIPLIRRLFLKGGVFFLYLLYGIHVTDSQNGLRAMSRKAVQRMELLQDRMPHAGEILDEIHRKKIKFVEVPVFITYSDYSLSKGENRNSLIASMKIAFRLIWEKFLN
jgi:glycosyltransferase involved in cell wall biosynthesis